MSYRILNHWVEQKDALYIVVYAGLARRDACARLRRRTASSSVSWPTKRWTTGSSRTSSQKTSEARGPQAGAEPREGVLGGIGAPGLWAGGPQPFERALPEQAQRRPGAPGTAQTTGRGEAAGPVQ